MLLRQKYDSLLFKNVEPFYLSCFWIAESFFGKDSMQGLLTVFEYEFCAHFHLQGYCSPSKYLLISFQNFLTFQKDSCLCLVTTYPGDVNFICERFY